jgi:hypothetical protein
MTQGFKIPLSLLLLDGAGCLLVVLGVLGAMDFDIGLPVLATIWPILIVIGVGLMAPMVVWAIKLARSRQ